MKLTLAELRKRLSDGDNPEEAAYRIMEDLRWPNGPECPHCGHDKAYYLKPKNPAGRRSGADKAARSVRRVWKCAKCRKQFSVLTNTIFHGTKVALSDWLTVMVLMSASKNGIAAREVERLIGVTPETAWFMCHRLREAMRRESILKPMDGVVVADETWIGGKEGNRHVRDRAVNAVPDGTRIVPGDRASRNTHRGKTAVLSLIDAETGEVRSKVIPDVTGHTLRKVIAEHCDMPNTILYTDESSSYRQLEVDLKDHKTVNHSEDEYVRYEGKTVITSNRAESYFSQLKRSIDGTHHHVSAEHLQRYLDEFDFRYTTRTLSDAQRLQRMVDQADGRRLTYNRVTEN